MRAGYLWIASFLLYPIVGAPLVKHPAFRVFRFPTRVVLSGGVGMVLVSWTMTLFALVGVRWGPLVLLVAAAFALSLRLVVRGAQNQEIPSPRAAAGEREGSPLADKNAPAATEGRILAKRAAGGQGEGRFSRATTLLAYALIALSLLAALAATMAARSTSPDLLLFWGPKAQQFATARTIDVAFLKAPYLEYVHVYYPPLVTNVFALGAMIAGRLPWGAATLTFPLLLAATAIGIAGLLRTEVGAARATAGSALATSALALVGIHASVAGNAEPFLLFFEILVVALLLSPAAATTGGRLLAGLLLAGAAASKVEGLPFVLATTILFVLADRARSRPVGRALFFLLGPAAVALGSWFAFGKINALFRGYRGYGEVLAVRWDQLSEIATAMGGALWKTGYALPWIVPLAVWIVAGRKKGRVFLPIGIAAALLGFLVFTYLTTESDPRLLIGWSAARTLSPASALFALAAFASRTAEPDWSPPSRD